MATLIEWLPTGKTVGSVPAAKPLSCVRVSVSPGSPGDAVPIGVAAAFTGLWEMLR